MIEYILFVDNGIKGHTQSGGKGKIASAFALFDRDAKLISEGFEMESDVTNNYGEMKAIKLGLLDCLKKGMKKIIVLSDSELCVKWISGEYQIRNENVKPCYLEVKELLKSFEEYKVNWIKRDLNIYADWLTGNALQEFRRTPKKIGLKEDALDKTQKFILSQTKLNERGE